MLTPVAGFLAHRQNPHSSPPKQHVVTSQSKVVLDGFKRATNQRTGNTKKVNGSNNRNKAPATKQKTTTKDLTFKKLSTDNDLLTNHKHRLATAGKIGTKAFADPSMIFVGNLNLTATEDQLKELLLPHVATPWDITKIQLVRDWKTGISKGYAFVRFTEPVFATLCLQELQGYEFMGRVLSVKPAKSKSESPLRRQQREEQLRQKALRRAANPPPPPPEPKREDPEFLAYLDPDLAVGLEAEGNDEGYENEGDDEDDEVDGWEVPGSAPPRGFG